MLRILQVARFPTKIILRNLCVSAACVGRGACRFSSLKKDELHNRMQEDSGMRDMFRDARATIIAKMRGDPGNSKTIPRDLLREARQSVTSTKTVACVVRTPQFHSVLVPVFEQHVGPLSKLGAEPG